MIKILKLLTGEEIIGEVDIMTDKVIISKPCQLQLVPSRANPDQPMMALFPYASYTKNHKITVFTSTISWIEEPVAELYNQYNSVFGSGLVLPKV